VRVTVCELPHDPEPRDEAWTALIEHCRAENSDLVVLPEMPFSVWLAATKEVEPERWDDAVASHEAWLERLAELGASVVIGARPVVVEGRRHNEGFVWEHGRYIASHLKYYLPDEDGFWEATWYERGPAPHYPAIGLDSGTAGILLCTEVWFTEHARRLGRSGIELLATPRATEWNTRERWLTGGRVAAMMAGAFGLSSNHSGIEANGMRWGGYGWIVDPNGSVLATTSEREPFATVGIDLLEAARAKATYPRYVAE
jgi:N-carbamoylputrescine amidase